MRLFIGIEPSVMFRSALASLKHSLISAGVSGRYLDVSNFHMTLAYIGEWPESVLDLLPDTSQPFMLTLSRFGLFTEAKVLYAGVSPNPALLTLADLVRDRLSSAGVPFDPKPFTPHFTLIRRPVIPESISLNAIDLPHVSMQVDHLCLYESRHLADGVVYTVIGRK